MSSAARKNKAILPWWQLALLLAACGFGVWYLLPDDPNLIDNLMRDRQYAQARVALGKLSSSKRATNEAHYREIEVQLDRRELKLDDPVAVARFWRFAASAWRDSGFSSTIFAELVGIAPALKDPAGAWADVAPQFTSAPAAQRERLSKELVAVALALGQPVTAAEIFAAAHPAASRTPDAALELARLWSSAGRLPDALAALGEIRTPEVVARRVEVLRALNRNPEALTLLRDSLAQNPQADRLRAITLPEVALAAGTPDVAVPYLKEYLASHNDDLTAQRRLRDLLLASGKAADAVGPAQQAAALSQRDPNDLRELARILEYSGRPGPAFDAWLELVLAAPPGAPSADTLAALDRLLALNPGLYRDADIARALTKLVPVPGHPEYGLRLARLNVSLGLFAEARAAYARYLTTSPTDADALVEAAHLQSELYRFTDAEALLRSAITLRATDLGLRRELAENLVAQGRNIDALALYRELAIESDAEEIIGPYIRIAESLGRYDDFTKGLRRRIDRMPNPTARDYVLLSYGYEVAEQPAQRQAALDEGLRRLGKGDDLHFLRAITLSAEKKYAAAQAALTPHSGLHTESAVASLYLELLRLNNDTAGERRYLAEPFSPELLKDEAILERIARARESLRDYAEAERIWRQLLALHPNEFERAASLARVLLLRNHAAEANRLLAPFLRSPTPPILKLAAEIAEAAGDHRAAEKYQLAYLEAVRSAPAQDWGALGDIRLSRGDRTGAKRAYAEALRRLLAQLNAKGGQL